MRPTVIPVLINPQNQKIDPQDDSFSRGQLAVGCSRSGKGLEFPRLKSLKIKIQIPNTLILLVLNTHGSIMQSVHRQQFYSEVYML